MQWSPVVDYIDLFDQPMNLMIKGQIPSIPVLMVRFLMFSSCFDYLLVPSWKPKMMNI